MKNQVTSGKSKKKKVILLTELTIGKYLSLTP